MSKKSDKKKTPFWYNTSFFVGLYFVVVLFAMLLQLAACFFASSEVIQEYITAHVRFSEFLNANLDLPITAFMTLWVGVSAAYIGVDRAAFTLQSSQLEAGQADYGEPKKLRRTILWSGILLLVSILGEGLKDGTGADFAASEAAVAFGTCITFYVAGQKAISAAKFKDGDLNGDGKVDEEDEKLAEAMAPSLDDETLAKLIESLNSPESEEAKKAILSALWQTIKDCKRRSDE